MQGQQCYDLEDLVAQKNEAHSKKLDLAFLSNVQLAAACHTGGAIKAQVCRMTLIMLNFLQIFLGFLLF